MNNEALSIINNWCDMADKHKLFEHKCMFWIARDVIEEKLHIQTPRIGIVTRFIHQKCKPSNEKEIIIAELKKHLPVYHDRCPDAKPECKYDRPCPWNEECKIAVPKLNI